MNDDNDRSIAEMSNPGYWEKELPSVSASCVVCSRVLVDKVSSRGGADLEASVSSEQAWRDLSKHHCRACGKFVCILSLSPALLPSIARASKLFGHAVSRATDSSAEQVEIARALIKPF